MADTNNVYIIFSCGDPTNMNNHLKSFMWPMDQSEEFSAMNTFARECWFAENVVENDFMEIKPHVMALVIWRNQTFMVDLPDEINGKKTISMVDECTNVHLRLYGKNNKFCLDRVDILVK